MSTFLCEIAHFGCIVNEVQGMTGWSVMAILIGPRSHVTENFLRTMQKPKYIASYIYAT